VDIHSHNCIYNFSRIEMTTNEVTNKLTKQIKDYIEKVGGYAERINVKGIRGRKSTNPGHPDIDCCFRGKSFKVEIKNSEKDALNPNQQQFKRRYESAGGKVFVVWDLELFQTDFKIWVCKF